MYEYVLLVSRNIILKFYDQIFFLENKSVHVSSTNTFIPLHPLPNNGPYIETIASDDIMSN
jgi:hypothetical protein